MKKRNISVAVLGFAFLAGLTSCGSSNNTSTENSSASTPSVTQPSYNPSDSTETADESFLVSSYKSNAVSKLDELVNPVIAKIPDDDLRNAIQIFYDTEKQYIDGIQDLDTAKEAMDKVVADTKDFAKDTLKPLAIQRLNSTINPLIEKITYEALKNSAQEFYVTEMSKIDATETLAEVSDTFQEILNDTKAFISAETEKAIITLKNKALEELDPYVEALIQKIPYDTLNNTFPTNRTMHFAFSVCLPYV